MQEQLLHIKAKWWLFACVLLALVLRLYHLGFQSLWIDELFTMNMADPAHSPREIYALSKTTDGLSVFYFLIINTFFKLFGFTATVARMVSVLFGTLGVLGIYLLGKELFNKRTGLIASLLLALNYFHIYYSQEARSYAMFATCTIFSFYFLIRFTRRQTIWSGLCYGLWTLLMLWSHFFGLFVLVAQGAIMGMVFFTGLRTSRKSYLLSCGLSYLLIGIGFLPLLPIFKKWAAVKSFWIPPVSGNAFQEIYSEFFGGSLFTGGLVALFILFYLARTFFPAWLVAGKPGEQLKLRPALYILLAWILITFLIPFVRSFLVVPMLQSRYMIAILPALLLLAAGGVSLVYKRVPGNIILLVFVLVSLSDLLVVKHYYTTLTKQNFRDASKYVVDNNASHTRIMTTMPYHFKYYFKLYQSPVMVDSLPMKQEIASMMRGELDKQAFWIVEAYHMELNLPDSGKAYLKENFAELKSFKSEGAWAKLYQPLTLPTDSPGKK